MDRVLSALTTYYSVFKAHTLGRCSNVLYGRFPKYNFGTELRIFKAFVRVIAQSTIQKADSNPQNFGVLEKEFIFKLLKGSDIKNKK